MKHESNADKPLNQINKMKRNLFLTFLAIALATGAILNQGCEDSAKSNALNQKVDELSKKVDTILQNQAELKQAELKSQAELQNQQDAIVRRIADWGFYYNTNLIARVNENDFRINLALENDLKGQISELKEQLNDIQKQIKPGIGSDFRTLHEKVDAIKRTTDQLQIDNQKIKDKLGVLF
jgi:outer membrane murein-binding lipoprotein Lpp